MALDELHDRKVRGIFGVLTALAELADDPNSSLTKTIYCSSDWSTESGIPM